MPTPSLSSSRVLLQKEGGRKGGREMSMLVACHTLSASRLLKGAYKGSVLSCAALSLFLRASRESLHVMLATLSCTLRVVTASLIMKIKYEELFNGKLTNQIA